MIASGVKSDALYETCHPGTYLYDVDKANKPNDERGAIIAFGYNGVFGCKNSHNSIWPSIFGDVCTEYYLWNMEANIINLTYRKL